MTKQNNEEALAQRMADLFTVYMPRMLETGQSPAQAARTFSIFAPALVGTKMPEAISPIQDTAALEEVTAVATEKKKRQVKSYTLSPTERQSVDDVIKDLSDDDEITSKSVTSDLGLPWEARRNVGLILSSAALRGKLTELRQEYVECADGTARPTAVYGKPRKAIPNAAPGALTPEMRRDIDGLLEDIRSDFRRYAVMHGGSSLVSTDNILNGLGIDAKHAPAVGLYLASHPLVADKAKDKTGRLVVALKPKVITAAAAA